VRPARAPGGAPELPPARTLLPADDVARLRTAARRVLDDNWREGVRRRDGVPFAFTCPSTPRYRHMWHWDSCFHAIARIHLDPARARAELRTVLRTADPDGFLPHTVFWNHPAGWRRAPLYATRTTLGSTRTETIGPPLLAVAWERVAAVSDADPAFATEALPLLARHLDWLAHHRDPDGDGLLTIVLPDESGVDDSPKYDPVYGRYAHHRAGAFLAIENCRRHGWHSHRIIASTDLHVEDVLVTVAYALSLHAMARMTADASYARRAARVEQALLEKSLDPGTGLFYDLAGRQEKPVRVSTWTALAPLALPGIPDDVKHRLVEEHLLHPRRYGAPVGIPSVAMDEPTFNPTFDRWRCWRGPSWVNTAWLLVPALRDLGHGEAADAIVRGLAAAALRHGLREYYDPRDGAGMAARGFGWSALLLDMAA
jgi:glycogen debranching enzyme